MKRNEILQIKNKKRSLITICNIYIKLNKKKKEENNEEKKNKTLCFKNEVIKYYYKITSSTVIHPNQY
jgi:hypothetical protein